MSIRSLLRCIHFMAPFNEGVIAEAEKENMQRALEQNEIAMSRVETSNSAVKDAQTKLLTSIRTAMAISAHGGSDKVAQLVNDMRSMAERSGEGYE